MQLRTVAFGWVLVVTSFARAAPGDAPTGEREPVEALDPPLAGRSCPKSGAICWFVSEGQTVRVPSDAIAAVNGGAGLVPAPRFSRAFDKRATAANQESNRSWAV